MAEDIGSRAPFGDLKRRDMRRSWRTHTSTPQSWNHELATLFIYYDGALRIRASLDSTSQNMSWASSIELSTMIASKTAGATINIPTIFSMFIHQGPGSHRPTPIDGSTENPKLDPRAEILTDINNPFCQPHKPVPGNSQDFEISFSQDAQTGHPPPGLYLAIQGSDSIPYQDTFTSSEVDSIHQLCPESGTAVGAWFRFPPQPSSPQPAQPPYQPQQPEDPNIQPGWTHITTLPETSIRPSLTLHLAPIVGESSPDEWDERTLGEQVRQSLEMYLARAAYEALQHSKVSQIAQNGQLTEISNHARVYLAGRFGINDQPPRVSISVDRPVNTAGPSHEVDARVNLDGNPNISELHSVHQGGTDYTLEFNRPDTGRLATLICGRIQDHAQQNGTGVRELGVLDSGTLTLTLQPRWVHSTVFRFFKAIFYW
ncbi:hypothetical protein ONS95_012867 [Cadophora gregata]|uniref:uncharacterized protein n=1 Tax=Cadophora gregata TaxID=51156 RepID=UPI0026DD2DF9|nr:uncharacterized protein ONS95_012867 [Cadophora gregata]KAK0115816.1 hypothetical protein ONS95_012867 [Cadophora gregata]